MKGKATESVRVKCWATTLLMSAVLSAGLALAEDFRTNNGKVYKDASIHRVEADGIVLRTKTGISKIYFVELPVDIQARFHYDPAKTVQVPRERQPIKVEAEQKEPREADASGWTGALQLSATLVRLLAIGALIITGVVLIIVRSRFG